ncbi:hypothetical protein [Neorhizobium sp. DAR64872/K0K18]|uniref:hypothetical protein n=1 Tax=Neorhizobium sp. DAR64872/K0K18 TaxID=3421958 RepID=UPI003D292FAF
MVNQTFVDLDRRFVQMDDQLRGDMDDWSCAGPGVGWDALLKEPRAIVLAEAGAGKTQEIKAAIRKLRLDGKHAFFMRLEEVSDGVTAASFDERDTGDLRGLDEWLDGNDAGWLMLDSVDEARLTSAKNFERAVKLLASKLGDAALRANIIVTSRASEWRPTSDLLLVNTYLPLPEIIQRPPEPNPDGFEPLLDAISDQVDGSEEQRQARIFSLLPLDEPRICELARHFGVNEPRTFYNAVEQADAVGFASRPKDLEDLAGYWITNGSIDGRLALVVNDIELKLKERDRDRADKRLLAPIAARSGARTLAAAASMLRDQQFCVPDNDGGLKGIDVSAILNAWSDGDCQTLLSRPIFDEAIYGRVRFHHRSVREFLAAEWVLGLLRKGNSRRRVEQLFFKTQYGIELVIPAMRPLLPWIALEDERIRNKTAKIAPEILTEGGDPGKFSREFRARLIEDICARHATAGTGRLLDSGAVRRMATRDLGSAISELLTLYEGNDVVRISLLRMAWQGAMVECLEQAKAFALNISYDGTTRSAAIQVVAATAGQAELAQFRDNLLASIGERDLVVFGECLRSLGKILDLKRAIEGASSLLGPDKYGFQLLTVRFVEYTNELSLAECRTALDEILVKLQEAPFKDGRNYRVSDKAYWLLPVGARACERLVEARDPFALSPTALDIISLTEKAALYDRSSIKTDLGAKVKAWSDLNEHLFWHQISTERAKGRVIRNWWQVSEPLSFWQISSADFGRLVAQIGQKQEDDRFVALSAAFECLPAEAREENIALIREAIGNNPNLAARLEEFLDPSPSPEQLEAQRRRLEHAEEMDRHELEREAQLERWKTQISQNLTLLSAVSSGGITRAQLYMLEALRDLDLDRNRLAHANWQGLVPSHGDEVVQAFKDGAQRYWRHYVPQLRSEGLEAINSTPHQTYLGLTGLEFNSQEEGWLDALSSDDAKLATRYALCEMNGFSDWLGSLAERFPSEVVEVLFKEIGWEFVQDDPDSYVIDDLVWHGEQLRPIVGPQLLTLLSSQEPRSLDVLRGALKIVSTDPKVTDAELAVLAEAKVKALTSSDNTALWVALWLTVQAPEAIAFFDSYLVGLTESNAQKFTMAVSSAFLSHDHDWVSKRENFKTPSSLKRLYEIFCRHIKRSEDTKRVHLRAYSPEGRDHAQRERDLVLRLLGEIEGKEAFIALMELANTHADQDIRPYIRSAALARAEADANLKPWTAADFHAYENDLDRSPGSSRELFELVWNRLLDFKEELEEGDDSIASIVHKTGAETVQRNFFGKLFRDRANGRYFAPNEEELADAKRPDIRIHAPDVHGPVPIEFKIADSWTGPKLFERLQNQLVNDYLRDARSSYGIFLMSNRGVKRQSWEHPVTLQMLTFEELCIELQNFADDYIAKRPDIDGIKVVGIDLTKRLQERRPDQHPRERRRAPGKTTA